MENQLLTNLTVVLVRTKSSENIGSVARVCLNMGCPHIVLVRPRAFEFHRALNLATLKGKPTLDHIQITDTLSHALAPFQRTIATSTQKGRKWKDTFYSPSEIAPFIATDLSTKAQVALVFGPEDSGLTKDEISTCQTLITIPTSHQASSLNLSQAVLIILYECFKARLAGSENTQPQKSDCRVPFVQVQNLLHLMKSLLIKSGFIPKDNSSYFMLPFKRFFDRIELRDHEYKLFMALCRHINWIISEQGIRTTSSKHTPFDDTTL
jgi:tRNA/rRNA methyltransferase